MSHWENWGGPWGTVHINTEGDLTLPRLSRRQKKAHRRFLKRLYAPLDLGPVMAGWVKMRGLHAACKRSGAHAKSH